MAYQPSLSPDLYVRAGTGRDIALMERMAAESRSPTSTDRNKPRVTLMVGPSPFSMPRGWEFFLTSPYEGVSYIASVLENAGYPVRIVDVRYDRTPLETALREAEIDTDVLGVATFEDNYPWAEELVNQFKAKNPDKVVILGGSLVTSVPHVFMRETKADIAVISEGELTILEVMDAITDGTFHAKAPQINGIWYRTPGGDVKRTTARGQMLNLDALPNMNLSLWPQSKDPRGLQPQIISSHSRGCKMDCSFCYRTTPQLREKSPEKLRAELKYLKETYNIKFIFFVDLTFTSNKKRTLAICDVISEFDLRWTCLTRCADVDPEILAAMKRAGCDIVLYGVESLTPDALKDARKGSTENLAERAYRLTTEAGLRFGGLIIVGLPNETPTSMDHTAQWAEKNRSITRVKYLSAMPGTSVYQQALQTGIIADERKHLQWLAVEEALHRDEFLNYNGVADEDMRNMYKRVYDSYNEGPVMDFQHFPEHFAYYDPDPQREWRKSFSSAGGVIPPEFERYRGLHIENSKLRDRVSGPMLTRPLDVLASV